MVYPYNGILISNKKERTTNATAWLDLINSKLSERRQAQKRSRII